MKNADLANGKAVSRRTLLTGAAVVPAALALPAIVLPRPGLAETMQVHIDAIASTLAPFALGRGADRWTFTASDRGKGAGGDLTITALSEELDRNGWPRHTGMEVFNVIDGELLYSLYGHGQDEVQHARRDFTI